MIRIKTITMAALKTAKLKTYGVVKQIILEILCALSRAEMAIMRNNMENTVMTETLNLMMAAAQYAPLNLATAVD